MKELYKALWITLLICLVGTLIIIGALRWLAAFICFFGVPIGSLLGIVFLIVFVAIYLFIKNQNLKYFPDPQFKM